MPPTPMDGDIYVDNERFLVPCNTTWSSSISGMDDFSIDGDSQMLYKGKTIYYNGVAVLSTDNTVELCKYVTLQTLAGTKWVLNSNIDLYESLECHVNFLSNDSQHSAFTVYDIGMEDDKGIYYDDTKVYSPWTNEAYRTIEITDGTDTTNSNLISWLEANAAQQIEPEPSDNKITVGSLPIASISFGNQKVVKMSLGNIDIYNANTVTTTPIIFFISSGIGESTSYSAEADMTWAEYVNSSYNTDNFQVFNNFIINSGNVGVRLSTQSSLPGGGSESLPVSVNDEIIDQATYNWYNFGGSEN